MRGLAVLIMIFWHSVDAWTAPSARGGPAFAWIIVIGGCAAPLFLFLAGISVALAGEMRLRTYPRPEGRGLHQTDGTPDLQSPGTPDLQSRGAPDLQVRGR